MASLSFENRLMQFGAPVGEPFRHSGLFKNRWVYHSIFWLIYYFYLIFIFFGIYQVRDFTFFVQLLSFIPLDLVLVYLNLYVLLPRLLSPRKYYQYGISLLIALLVFGIASIFLKKFYNHLGYSLFAEPSLFSFSNISGSVLGGVDIIVMTTAVKLLKDWIANQQAMKEMEKQYLETELNFLKSQIQPHFFFNTLNNLYSLTLKKSDLAPEIVLKLSELMSYMLYESNTSHVLLNKEISYLQSYLDLEKLRVGNRLVVNFEMEGQTEGVRIPPMLLILFIENSFKHGVKNNLNKIKIEISLKIVQGFLFFEVRNPIVEDFPSAENPGIGLNNVRRRLELLYGKNFSLDLGEKEKEYVVSLKIPVC